LVNLSRRTNGRETDEEGSGKTRQTERLGCWKSHIKVEKLKEVAEISKDVTMAYFKVLIRHSPGQSEACGLA
jgi:hypothetical protein